MRSLLLPIALLTAGLTFNGGCMLPNFGNDDEEESPSSESSGASEEKEVPGSGVGSDNDAGNDAASDGDVRTERGSLSTGDRTLNSGEYADLHNVSVDAGETVIVQMTSSQFDPYLILRPPGGTQVDNDDYNGDRTVSRIEYVATTGGNHEIIATSYQPGESGQYEVTIEVGEGIGGGAGAPSGSGSK